MTVTSADAVYVQLADMRKRIQRLEDIALLLQYDDSPANNVARGLYAEIVKEILAERGIVERG